MPRANFLIILRKLYNSHQKLHGYSAHPNTNNGWHFKRLGMCPTSQLFHRPPSISFSQQIWVRRIILSFYKTRKWYSERFSNLPKVKNPPGMQVPIEMWVQSLGWKDPLEEEMATHFIIPAWKISWAPQRILAGYTPWGRKEPDPTEQLSTLVIQSFWPQDCPFRFCLILYPK